MCKGCSSIYILADKFYKKAQEAVQEEVVKEPNIELSNCEKCGKPDANIVNLENKETYLCKDCDSKTYICWFTDCDYQSFDEDKFEYFDVSKKSYPFCIRHQELCTECGTIITSENDLVNYNRDSYHEDCFNDNFSECESCNHTYENTDMTYIDNEGVSVCDSCLDENYFKCHDCHEYIHNNDSFLTSYGYSICQKCLENDYNSCEECGDIYSNEDMNFDNNGSYCDDCYDGSGGIDKNDGERVVNRINNKQPELYPIDNKSIDGNILSVLNAAYKKYKDIISESSKQDIVSKIFGQEQKAAVEIELNNSERISEVINTFNELKEYNNHMKQSYPKLKGFKPLPVKAKVVEKSGHQGFTISVPVNDKMLDYAEKIQPGAKIVYEKMLRGSGHHDAICYIRLTKSNNALIIDNIQTDWDLPFLRRQFDNITQRYNLSKQNNNEELASQYSYVLSLEPAVRWWSKAIDKFFVPFLLDYAKKFAQDMELPLYLTSFEMQSEKWRSIPERSKDIYESTPAQMGFGKEEFIAKPESLKEDSYTMSRIAKLLSMLNR